MDLTPTLDALGLNTQSLITAFLTSLSGLAIYLGYQLTRKVRAYLTPAPPSAAVQTLANLIHASDMKDWIFKEGDWGNNYVDHLKNGVLDLRIGFGRGKCIFIDRLSDQVTFTQGITSGEKRLLCQEGERCLKAFKEHVIFTKSMEETFKQPVKQSPLPQLTPPTMQWVDAGHPYPSEGEWRKFDKK